MEVFVIRTNTLDDFASKPGLINHSMGHFQYHTLGRLYAIWEGILREHFQTKINVIVTLRGGEG